MVLPIKRTLWTSVNAFPRHYFYNMVLKALFITKKRLEVRITRFNIPLLPLVSIFLYLSL